LFFVPVRALGACLGALTLTAIASPAALAASAGGVSAGGATPTAAGAAPVATSKPLIHLSPITARSQRLSYRGPVFQRNASGEVLPYLPGQAPGAVGATGGIPVGVVAAVRPQLLVPGSLARYVGGLAAAPMSAPASVQQAIWAANGIIGLPYVYGGGHASFEDSGYDCSGTVSFALHGGGLLTTPMDSSELETWGSHGAGRWITVFSNAGHAYVDIAGLRLDTSAADDPSHQHGPRWRPLRSGNGGYTVRHPLGL
jgi:cell wall-associated NlpC family hydrolase